MIPAVPATGRYTSKLKAWIVRYASKGGGAEIEVARVHGISTDELASWMAMHAREGVQGLKISMRPRKYGQRLKTSQRPPEGQGRAA
jgi:transposase-like protein